VTSCYRRILTKNVAAADPTALSFVSRDQTIPGDKCNVIYDLEVVNITIVGGASAVPGTQLGTGKPVILSPRQSSDDSVEQM
jgi:hypothetical protein